MHGPLIRNRRYYLACVVYVVLLVQVSVVTRAAMSQRTITGSYLDVATAIRSAVKACAPSGGTDSSSRPLISALPELVRISAEWVVSSTPVTVVTT